MAGIRKAEGSSYVIIPDITPWSYPKRKTPNDTKILVKYLERFY